MLGRLLLAAGLMSTYCYCADFFFTALGGDDFDRSVMLRRFTGDYAFSFWLIVGAALIPIHLLWFRAVRRSALMLCLIGLLVMLGHVERPFHGPGHHPAPGLPAVVAELLRHQLLGGVHVAGNDRPVQTRCCC